MLLGLRMRLSLFLCLVNLEVGFFSFPTIGRDINDWGADSSEEDVGLERNCNNCPVNQTVREVQKEIYEHFLVFHAL